MADAILLPRLTELLREYPDIKVEIVIDYGLTDIVAQRFDAGVRSGEQVAKDMIAVARALLARLTRTAAGLELEASSCAPGRCLESGESQSLIVRTYSVDRATISRLARR